jgi:hypothetical protein
MAELRLPVLIGRRENVRAIMAEQGVPEALDGERLILLCRGLRRASASFADEMVREALVVRGATDIALLGAPSTFVADLQEAAQRYGVTGRVAVRRAVDVGV